MPVNSSWTDVASQLEPSTDHPSTQCRSSVIRSLGRERNCDQFQRDSEPSSVASVIAHSSLCSVVGGGGAAPGRGSRGTTRCPGGSSTPAHRLWERLSVMACSPSPRRRVSRRLERPNPRRGGGVQDLFGSDR